MTDWSSLKVVDLKAELSSRGLPTKGLKAELVQRLTGDDDAAAAVAELVPVAEDQAAEETEPSAADNAPKNGSLETQSNAEETNPADAPANEDMMMQPVAASDPHTQSDTPPTPQEPAPIANSVAQTEQNDQPAFDTSIPSIDAAADLQKRKRRSVTPQPSSKRARQESERLADNYEDVVDFEVNNNASVSPMKSQNGEDKNEDAPEDREMMDASLEVSGEDAYAKRVAIAEASKLRSGYAPQSQGMSRAESEEDAYAKRMAPIQPSEQHPASLPLQPGPSLDQETAEDAYAKRVAIAESSKQSSTSRPQSVAEEPHTVAHSRSPQPEQKPHEYLERDDPQQSQGPIKTEEDDSLLPSLHSPTSALYIRELMRPLKSEAMEQHIVDLISSSGQEFDADPIHDFYLDQVRTHAFVRLPSISAARLVRAALHNQVWPNERNRKALWVDYIPAENAKDWIEREESAPRGARWEVVYEQVRDDTVAIHREVGSDSKPFSRPPPTGPAAVAPVYPGVEGAPRGPRRGGGRSTFQDSNSRQTEAFPQLIYTPKDEDVARRRIGNMRSFYARDPPPDTGKDYHRYTFETADAFVDRGREVFIGIRPPHRQREHEERLRRERPARAGASSVAESRRDDYRSAPRPLVTDEDRFPRHGDGRRPDRFDWPPRNRGSRNDRGPGRYRGEDPYRYRPGY
ncbi:unnamed protein product [Discula destructiva]